MRKGQDRGLKIEGPEIPENWSGKDGTWPYPKHWYDWPKPFALEWHKWEEWRDELKAKHPVRYFLYEDVPIFFGRIGYRIRDAKWWILHRLHPKHRYHVVKTGLKPGYYDPRTLILETSFSLLVEFVEKNTEWDVINWDSDEGHKEAWREMNELVDWYKNIRPNREEEFDKQWPEPKRVRNWNDDTPEARAYKEYLDRYLKEEERWEQEDETNLNRLVKVRPYLWYA